MQDCVYPIYEWTVEPLLPLRPLISGQQNASLPHRSHHQWHRRILPSLLASPPSMSDQKKPSPPSRTLLQWTVEPTSSLLRHPSPYHDCHEWTVEPAASLLDPSSVDSSSINMNSVNRTEMVVSCLNVEAQMCSGCVVQDGKLFALQLVIGTVQF